MHFLKKKIVFTFTPPVPVLRFTWATGPYQPGWAQQHGMYTPVCRLTDPGGPDNGRLLYFARRPPARAVRADLQTERMLPTWRGYHGLRIPCTHVVYDTDRTIILRSLSEGPKQRQRGKPTHAPKQGTKRSVPGLGRQLRVLGVLHQAQSSSIDQNIMRLLLSTCWLLSSLVFQAADNRIDALSWRHLVVPTEIIKRAFYLSCLMLVQLLVSLRKDWFADREGIGKAATKTTNLIQSD